jgi:hypothetical protein
MRALAQIHALYLELDDHLESQRLMATDPPGVNRAEAKQRLNDQAFFLLAWGQLETEIDAICRKAIEARRSSARWADRRLWELFNPDDKRLSGLSFQQRAAVALDLNGAAFSMTMKHYNARNKIAHGELAPDRIDVDLIIKDFYVIQSALSA